MPKTPQKPQPKAQPRRQTPAAPPPRAQQSRAVQPAPAARPPALRAGADLMEGCDEAMQAMLEADAGLGVSTDPDDNLLQFIKVLQPMSPEVLAGADHVEGAAAGLFLCRGMDPEVHESIWFQPCGLSKSFLRFRDRDLGGGFVSRYDYGDGTTPAGAEPRDQSNPNRLWFPDSGDTCVAYRTVPGIVWLNGVPNEFVLNFYSTGHSVHRQWNGRMLKKRNPKTGARLPVFACVYDLTTTLKTNNQGSWYQVVPGAGAPLWSPTLEGIISSKEEAYDLGSQLAHAFDVGERQARYEEPVSEDADAGDGGNGGNGGDADIPF